MAELSTLRERHDASIAEISELVRQSATEAEAAREEAVTEERTRSAAGNSHVAVM